ncbi:MAG: alpha/beta hydrolase [Gammaproteobacteria bacterium]|nr:alpha/beta hydrolase [Gammaproteobacteria bacterium]
MTTQIPIKPITPHFTKYLVVFLLLLLSGCSTYHYPAHKYATDTLTQLSPKHVAIQNGQIEYYRTGVGSPIVLIPGYATDVSSWNREFLAELTAQHQIIILNNRGVGGSFNSSHEYNTQGLANDTYQLIQKLNLKKPTIIGISMGGMIAQQLAVLHQKALGSLVLINTSIAGKKAIHPSPEVEKQLLNLSKNKLGFYFSAIQLFAPPQSKTSMAYALVADRFYPKKINEIDAGKIMPKQQDLIRHWFSDNATAKKIGKLQLPVLIINGQADIVIPPINSIILANTIPHAKLVRWKNGGHAIIYQYPYEIGDTINRFVAAKTGSV